MTDLEKYLIGEGYNPNHNKLFPEDGDLVKVQEDSWLTNVCPSNMEAYSAVVDAFNAEGNGTAFFKDEAYDMRGNHLSDRYKSIHLDSDVTPERREEIFSKLVEYHAEENKKNFLQHVEEVADRT